MKRLILILIVLLSASGVHADDYYWVGGAGSWSDLSHWASSSGGPGNKSIVPGLNDDVYFDGNSGLLNNTIVTMPTTGHAYVRNISWAGVTTNAIFRNIAVTYQLNVYGNMELSGAMRYDIRNILFAGTGNATLKMNGAGKYVVANAVNAVNVNKPGGSLTLLDGAPEALNVNIVLTTGHVNLSGNTHALNLFNGSSSTSTRSADISNATLIIGNSWDYRGANGTLNATGSSIKAAVFQSDRYTFPKVEITGTSDLMIITTSTFGELTFSNPATPTGSVRIGGGNTVDRLEFMGGGRIATGGSVINQLILAPGKGYIFHGTNTINTRMQLNTPDCEGLGQLTGADANAKLAFATGAVVDLRNVYVKTLTATGAVTPITVVGADGGSNVGWNFLPRPSGTTLYWVGGAGDWNDKSHWSSASGGTGGACVPFTGDDVVFDANSGFTVGNNTVSLSGNSWCHNMTWTSVTGAPIVNMTAGMQLEVWGSISLDPTMTINGSVTARGTEVNTLTTNGCSNGTLSLTVNKENTAGGMTLTDNINFPGLNFVHARGQLNMSGRNINMNLFNSTSGVGRIMDISNATINVVFWNVGATNVTWVNNAAGSFITSRAFTVNGLTYPKVYCTTSVNEASIQNATFGELVFTNTAPANNLIGLIGNNTVGTLEFKSGAEIRGNNTITNLLLAPSKPYTIRNTQTVNGLFRFSTPDCNALGELRGVEGTSATINFGPAATRDLNNIYLLNMTAAGSGLPVTVSGADASGNTGFDITASGVGARYWVGGSGDWSDPAHWSNSSGGAGGACVPGVSNDVFFDANSFSSGSNAVTINNTQAYCRNMTWTGATFNPTLTKPVTLDLEIWGSLVLSPGVRIDAAMNFVGPSNVSITSNGPSTGLTQFYIMKPTGYTVTLQDDFNNSLAYIFPRSGGVNMSGRTVNLNGMDDGSSASPLTMNITGATITGAWRYMAANKTLLAANSVLKARRFLVNGGAYDVVDASGGTASDAYVFSTTVNSLLFSNPSGASAISVGSNNTIRRLEFKGRGAITGDNTIDTLIFAPGKTYTLTAGTNNTVTKEWYGSGTPCNLTEITSSTGTATITKTTGDVEFDYVRLRGITAAGVTPFKALEHSENLGNNMNWDIAPYNGSTPILGLGPDLLLCPDAFPYTIKTDGFFASPLASFTWNDGSTLETLTVTEPGTYSVTVSYPDGCSRTDNVIITRSDVPVAALTGTTAVCTGRTTTLSSATTGGVWSTSDAAVATVSTTGVVTGVTPGSVTITYTITNSNGCSASQDATITVNAVPVVADITGTLSVFQGSTTALTSTTAGGVWSSSNTAIASVSNTGVVSGVAPGTATITYTVTSPQGCDAAKTAIVTVDGFTADKRVLSLTKTADAAEPTTNGSFALRLPSGVLAEENITINYTVTGTAGMADYAALSGTATIPAGQNGVNLPVTVTDDALVEITETVIVNLNSATGIKYTYTLSPTDNNATVNITDDENTPAKRTLSIANAGNAVEGGAAGKFRISLPAGVNTSEDITVTYTISGTATNGTDYTTLGSSIIIPSGLSGVDVTVTTINDQIIEGNETVILTLTGGTTASIGAFTGTASATVNIADNDNTAANRTLLVSNIQNAAEPSSNGSFTIGLPAGVTVTEAINVNYAVTGTALSGVDYTALSGVVTIPAGQNSVTIPILVIDDALVELTETVIITLQNSSSASFTFTPATTGGSGTVNIADDDDIAANRVISITKKTDAAEPAASGAFRIGLPTGIIASENITVAYTVSGTATPGTDYVVLPATAVIPAGSNGIDLPVNVIDDTEIESTETVGLLLNSASAANLTYTISITQNAATVDIADDDFAGNSNVVLLTKVSDAVEGGVQGQYRISLKPGVTSSQDITVSFSLGGSAISGTDYTLTGLIGGNIVIPVGANEVLINVNAVDDGVVEGPEEVLLTLTGAASASYPFVVDPASNSATVNVIDANASNSTPIEVIGVVVNTSEPSTPGSFTVKLAGSATAAWPVTVGYALSGTAVSGLDYEALGTIVIPANTNSVTVALNILDDKIIEPVETAIFTLLSGSAIAGAAPAYIFPADATKNQVTINIADDDQAAGNRVLTVVKTTDGAEPATGGVYTVSLPADYTSSTPITLNYSMVGTATRNTDYTISGTTLPPNRNSVTIPVPVIDDQIIEGTEVLSMRMGNSTDANGFIYTVDPATTEVPMNITDDDADPAKLQLAVTNTGNAAEPANNGEFTISLPTGVTAAIDITVNYAVSGTATPGSDYVALPATLTIPAGQNSITVPVTVSDDQLIENTETVILAITGGTAGSLNLTPASGSSSAIVNITDDENTAANTVIGIAAGTNATEGTADVSSFTISLPMNILTPEAITVTYTIGGTATNGADYTLLSGTAVIPAGQNSVVVSTPATDDDIIETDESIILTLTGATSNGFSWTIHLTANEATTLIIDNDNTAANLALTIVNVTDAAEPATNGMFRLSLPTGKTVAEDVTVNYAVTGTATAGTDYTALTGSVVIPAGQSGVNIPVTVIDDQVVEPAETVILTINGGASTSFTFTGTGNATVNIADDESSVPANLALTISNTTDAAEPLTNGNFSIDLPAGITIMEDVTVAYTVTGTATAGTDYTVLSGTAVIPAGQSSVSIPVTVIDDQLVEQTETVVATLNGGSSTSFTFTGTGSATVNITDDESAGSLTLAISKTADGAEPATNGGFEISLPAGVISSEDITVHYAVSGTATRNADYTALSGTVVIPAGQNSATIPVDVLDDTIIEAVETVIVTLNGGSSANFTFSGTGSATVNIADNDNTAANLVLTITKLNDAAEPSTAGRVSIALPAGVTAAESVTVTYNVAGNASPDVDYAALSGTVIIPAGENSVMVPVSVIDDQVIEMPETVILALNGGTSTNFTFTATGSVTVNIADDDNVPANLVLNAAVNIAAAEPDVPGSFTVALPAGITATEDITVSYAVGGTATADEDYSSLTGIAVIPAGSNSVDVMVNILDDKLIEGSETLTLEITGGLSASLAFAPGPDKKAAMDIADDDADPINMILSITNGAHAAEPSTNGSFIISLPAGTLVSQDVTVTYTVAGTATAGTDYTALSGTAVIPAMGNSVTIPVTVLNDELIEQLETVTVTLTNSSAAIGAFTIGAANSATINIADDDAVNLKLGVTATQPAAAEPATNGGFTISIAGGKLTSEAITVQYMIGGSATPDADYQAISGIITIPAGASSVIVPVNVLNDDEVEDPETVVFTITGGTAANFSWTPDTNNEAIVTITSDDAHTGNLMITKQMVSPAIGPYRLGQDITYRVTVTNIGTGVSAGVTVADFLASQLGQPARTVASIGQTSFNATDLRIDWTIGDMAAGATAQLEVTYRLTDGGAMVLTAEAASTNTDTDPADNKASMNLLVEGSDLLFPNTFTPNGDGKNERFIIGGLDKYQGAKLQVFNRWGSQVYRSNDYRNDWNGSGLAESTYYYILEVKKTDGSVKAYKGWVLIVR